MKNTPYQKHEFCKAVNCSALSLNGKFCMSQGCKFTAKDFHRWLKKNGFEVTKKETAP